MKPIITYENLRSFAYSNDRLCDMSRLRGIAVSFFGLGSTQMFNDDRSDGVWFAKQNVLYVVPYNNPWAWMNRQAVDFTDEILDVLISHYNLPKSIPVASTGGSMGGLSAIVYCAYTRHAVSVCVANCPVCDLPYHFTERPDLPRTLYSAFWNVEGDVEEALKTASPIHLIDRLPDIDYHLFHCEKDKSVNITRHSEAFVAAMKPSHRITYTTVPGCPHCDLPADIRIRYNDCIVNGLK